MQIKSQRGVLIPTMFFIILLVASAGAILSLTLHSYRLSQRNEVRARARAISESELEFLFYQFKDVLIKGEASNASVIPSLLASRGLCDAASQPTTARVPFALAHTDADPLFPFTSGAPNDWIVKRSVEITQSNVLGTIPDSTKTGQFSYLVVRLSVEPGPTSPLHGAVSVKVGRRLSYATASIFQYNVFAEGDLEFAPGGNTIIEGDIAANGSVYMGASGGGTLTINGKVRYMESGSFNETADGLHTTYRKPGTYNAATGDIVTWDDSSLSPPVFGTSKASQVEPLKSVENLLGGLDAKSIAEANIDLFGPVGTEAELNQAMNNVYRSLIAPPPEAVAAALAAGASQTAEYPASTPLASTSDDPSIAALRAYNRAGLVVTVTPGSPPSVSVKDSSGSTVSLSGVITSSTMTDLREGKTVAVTEIDVGALATALDALDPSAPGGDFNGLLYVYLGNSSASTPAAVRLVNGAVTPNSDTAAGFSVATNGGLYVQGSYNTKPSADGTINPTMLVADSVTVLSDVWNDANSANTDLSTRPAHSTVVTPGDTSGPAVETTDASGVTTIVTKTYDSESNTTITVTKKPVVINAGILTGNVSATASAGSGGGQNLVRFLENWNQNSVVLKGSIGRLFDSTHYTAAFQQPGTIYGIPSLRTFAFNDKLKSSNVPGAPLITYFSRGNFFNW